MSAFDSNYLLELARKKSAESRNELASTVSDLFAGGSGNLTDRERVLMYEILHSVVRDAEMEVRKIISSRLADQGDAPLQLISMLSNDDIEVAFPILCESAVLHDEQLIEVVRHRTLEHQMAVSIRRSVSEEVSAALVEQGNERVIRTLLQNENANISGTTMEFLVEQSERVDTFQEPILHRRELKPEMAKRMYLWVSAALRKHIVENCGLDKSEVDDLLEKVALDSMEGGGAANDGSKSHELAATLVEAGAVSTDLMIRALKDGEVRLFVDLVAEATGVRHDLIMRFIIEPGGEALAVACRTLGMSDDEFKQVFLLCRKARPVENIDLREKAEGALTLFKQVTPESAAEVIGRWKRDSGYLSALRDLNMI